MGDPVGAPRGLFVVGVLVYFRCPCIPRSAAELFLMAGPSVHLLGAGGGAAGPSYWHGAARRVGQFTIIIFIIYMT